MCGLKCSAEFYKILPTQVYVYAALVGIVTWNLDKSAVQVGAGGIDVGAGLAVDAL
jgi:hypothetical protein